MTLTLLSDEAKNYLLEVIDRQFFILISNIVKFINEINLPTSSRNYLKRCDTLISNLTKGTSSDRLLGRSLKYIKQHLLFLKYAKKPLKLRDSACLIMQLEDLIVCFQERNILPLVDQATDFYNEYVGYFATRGINVSCDHKNEVG